MIDYGKNNILGIGISAVDYEASVMKIIEAARQKRPFAVSALAVHGIMTGALDAVHRHRLNGLDLVVPDGQPVRWALNWLYRIDLPDRVYGPNLTLKVCERAAAEGLGIYLYGSQKSVLDKFEANLQKQFPALKIAGKQPSLFRQTTAAEQTEIAETIRQSGASLVMVGLGCPRQETWVFENRELIGMPLLAVGAAFDFHAGTLAQAPQKFQDHGFEWLFRFFHEPKRLWKRYVYLNPLYLFYVGLQFANLRKTKLEDNIPPAQQMRFG